ncbi:hypothetical protein HMH01_06120 [Halovulum dunhuangense]|uniref:Uncharacterized protein n=1 Tax=Halovulum dunhuangense TaxID=1505036 RepID=A0A849L162_9RHOB|nr:hypothetical protein [Halovulum dunhuangense]NNU80012.1 hypothetical protein [Halovulum dunhuangense]
MIGLLYLLAAGLFAFGVFWILARALPRQAYRIVSRGLAAAPGLLWTAVGLTSNLVGLIVLLSLVIWAALTLAAIAAERVVHGRVRDADR